MRLPIWQVDAFTDRPFAGNPAAVVALETWPPDEVLQAIAAENNLSETAFLSGGEGEYDLRWFTPVTEVDLCGHATLASAHVVFEHLEPSRRRVVFATRSGDLAVEREEDGLAMDLPARPGRRAEAPEALRVAVGLRPVEARVTDRDWLLVLGEEADVRGLRPDLDGLARLDRPGCIVTAPGRDCDFVSRFFAPRLGVPEDPVTGSAHCVLVPYWAERLGRGRLRARQVSARGGALSCELRGDRVRLGGKVTPYLAGTIEL